MRVFTIAASAVLLAVSPVVFSGPAQAAVNGVCDGGESCLWKDNGKRGGVYESLGIDNDYHNNYFYNTTTRVEDQASGVWNRKTCTVRWYKDDSLSGASLTVQPNQSFLNMGTSGFGDEISSYGSCV